MQDSYAENATCTTCIETGIATAAVGQSVFSICPPDPNSSCSAGNLSFTGVEYIIVLPEIREIMST